MVVLNSVRYDDRRRGLTVKGLTEGERELGRLSFDGTEYRILSIEPVANDGTELVVVEELASEPGTQVIQSGVMSELELAQRLFTGMVSSRAARHDMDQLMRQREDLIRLAFVMAEDFMGHAVELYQEAENAGRID